FKTFLVGCTLPDWIFEKEKEYWSSKGVEEYRSIKQDFNRLIGTALEESGFGTVDFDAAEVILTADLIGDRVKARIRPLYVYGRYKKLVRGIPQTKWPCRSCRGRGCDKCNKTGKQYETSVEELMVKRLLEASGSKAESFSGGGREDIDALMLGTGRPFVVELQNPLKRTLDLKGLETKINAENAGKIEVNELRLSSKKEVVAIKAAALDKIYSITVKCDGLTASDLEKINALKDVILKQRTPLRVSHRRADLVRERKVYSVKAERLSDSEARLNIKAQSGTYIKEFVSGDSGRTSPSVAELIGRPCVCIALDVIEICG
ncbi:MAG: tRNA pseudouridine(54/55) synthase Pus10, partial [Candidatus Diapherotrites archaeon]|nr:tRNA pseudouridine(54/55) synthase Pus10 [Candidatus Diapherotrites archaeon]